MPTFATLLAALALTSVQPSQVSNDNIEQTSTWDDDNATGMYERALPTCKGRSGNLGFNNAQVISWINSTSDNFSNRAHVSGKIVKIWPQETGHAHVSVQLDNQNSNAIEVVYNLSFGSLPRLKVGMYVEACGDYITTSSSPDGAIVHWVHRSTSSHPSGFVIINNVVYGGL